MPSDEAVAAAAPLSPLCVSTCTSLHSSCCEWGEPPSAELPAANTSGADDGQSANKLAVTGKGQSSENSATAPSVADTAPMLVH